jgi:RimJ/RimL family protein N-acetyltransferase
MKILPREANLKSGLKVILRSVEAKDAADFLNHLCITHDESYRNLNSTAARWKKITVQEQEKTLSDILASANKFMLAAYLDEKIVAGLSLFGGQAEFNGHSAAIGMSVQLQFSNMGLGGAIFDYALESAKQIGIHRLDLTVRTYNLAAIALYEKFGFQRVGTLHHVALIDGQYVDEFYYEKIL